MTKSVNSLNKDLNYICLNCGTKINIDQLYTFATFIPNENVDVSINNKISLLDVKCKKCNSSMTRTYEELSNIIYTFNQKGYIINDHSFEDDNPFILISNSGCNFIIKNILKYTLAKIENNDIVEIIPFDHNIVEFENNDNPLYIKINKSIYDNSEDKLSCKLKWLKIVKELSNIIEDVSGEYNKYQMMDITRFICTNNFEFNDYNKIKYIIIRLIRKEFDIKLLYSKGIKFVLSGTFFDETRDKLYYFADNNKLHFSQINNMIWISDYDDNLTNEDFIDKLYEFCKTI